MYEDWELIDMYKRAKHKQAQIKILCQLTRRTEKSIREMLINAGFQIASKPATRKYDGGWSQAEIDSLLQWRKEGKKFTEIGELLGRTTNSVQCKYRHLVSILAIA